MASAPHPAAADVPATFRHAMRRLSSAVAVVTVNGPDGPLGIAATSVTSMSAEPPSILVCVNRSLKLHSCLAVGEPFNVNILSRGQSDVSRAFGGGIPSNQRFGIGDWQPDARGLLQLEHAQANLSCVAEILVPYATHTVVIGRVEAVRLSGDVDPLIYQNGCYL